MNMESFRSNTVGTGTDRSNTIGLKTQETKTTELEGVKQPIKPKLSMQLAKLEKGKMKIKSIGNVFEKHL